MGVHAILPLLTRATDVGLWPSVSTSEQARKIPHDSTLVGCFSKAKAPSYQRLLAILGEQRFGLKKLSPVWFLYYKTISYESVFH